MKPDIEKVVRPILERIDGVLGGSYSAMLYGSAVRDDFRLGRSDINLLVITDSLAPEALRKLAPVLSQFEKDGHAPPLLMTRDEWRRASDVFPIEIADMRLACEVVRGIDPLQDVRINLLDLRRSLEHEFRGRVLRLRQAYMALGEKPKELTHAVRRSFSSVMTLLRCSCVLLKQEVPKEGEQLCQSAGKAMGFDPGALLAILRGRDDKNWVCTASECEAYLTAVSRAVQFIDQLQPGDS